MMPESDNSAQGRSAPAEPGKRLYIVDDEAMIGEVVEAILRLEGFDPCFFSDPELALRTFQEEKSKPELLLTDFLMHPINGMELIQRCKQEDPGLKTILYSGNVGEEIINYYAIKPDRFLAKPFLPKALIELVQNVLEK